MGHVYEYKKRTKTIKDAVIDRYTGEAHSFSESVCINSKYDPNTDAYICHCYKCNKNKRS